MDLRYSREVTVGTIVIVAVLVFIFGTMWLSGRSVSPDELVRIQFANVSGLKEASPVRVSGVSVGKVERIEFVDVGKVLVGISIPDKLRPKVDATAEIVSVSLVGDYAVDFNPGQAAEPLPDGRVIIGSQERGFAARGATLADRADSLLVAAQAFVNEETAEQLRATMTALQGTLGAAERTMALYGDPNRGPSAELTRTLAALRQVTERFDSTLANPGLARAISRMDTLTQNLTAMTARLTSTTAQLDTLLASVNRGEGTLGKFVTDSGFYYDLREVSAQLKDVLAELQKNPGRIPVTVKLF